jgi:uncharacterized membrane protein (DUF373 family)
MFALLQKYEKIMIRILMVMMAVVLALAAIDLGWMIIKNVIKPPFFLLSVNTLLEIFGFVMLVVIGIELLETMKTYLIQSQPHYEIVLSVAIIAIARKVIILDLKEVDSLTLFGIASIILALTVGYFLMQKKGCEK